MLTLAPSRPRPTSRRTPGLLQHVGRGILARLQHPVRPRARQRSRTI